MIPQPGRLKDEIHGLGGRLLDLLFPPRCVNCGALNTPFCARCLALIQLIPPPLCPRCGRHLDRRADLCPDCKAHPLSIHRIRAVGWHEGALREAVHALKYQHRRELARPLGRLLADYLTRVPVPFDIVTAVPLYPVRELERGYNQAELLARETARLTRTPYLDALARTRATQDQVGLDGPARRANVQEAFTVVTLQTAGKRVLVIDDVCTTGATLDSAAMTLLASGAAHVFGLTVTRAHSLV